MFASRTNWALSTNPISLRLEEIRRSGVKIIDLTESNPTRCGFQYLKKEKWLSYLADPKNMIYEPSPAGSPEARQAVSDYYARKGISVNPNRIFLIASTSEAYSFLFRLIANAGERILAPRPSYPLFDFLAALNDIELDPYPLLYDSSWRIDVEKLKPLAGPKTKAMILVHPNNPTGSCLKHSELKKINALAKQHELVLISDEVFSDYLFAADHKFVSSLAGNSPVLTFTLGGISKALGLPQMKLAWIVVSGPENLAKGATERLEIILDTYLSVNTPVQRSLPAWFSFQNEIQDEIRSRLKENRQCLTEHLEHHTCEDGNTKFPRACRNHRMPTCESLHSEGGWVAVLKIPRIRTEEEWVLEFLSKDRVYVHPGYFFDFEEEAYLVLSLLPPPEIFEEGIHRILSRIEKTV